MWLLLVACSRPTCPAGMAFDQAGLCVAAPSTEPTTGSTPTDTPTDTDTDTPTDTDTDTPTDTDTTGSPVGAACDPEAPTCVAGAVCCTACCAAGATPVCTAGESCPLPDLTIDTFNAAMSMAVSEESFAEDSCAVREGCVVAGTRRLLRFTTTTPNLGTGPITLGIPAHDPRFGWSDCHGHYHFRDYVEASVLDGKGVRVTGQKQAFCLMDSEPWDDPAPGPVYHCGNQGISVGWADTYVSALDCQWVDVTDLPSGSYTLRLTVDPTDQFPDLDETNDSTEIPFDL